MTGAGLVALFAWLGGAVWVVAFVVDAVGVDDTSLALVVLARFGEG